MFNRLRKYLKNEAKGMALMLIVSVAICIGFALYINLVGYPMTQARKYFNEGKIAYENEDWNEASRLFGYSLDFWYTSEAGIYLAQTDNQLNR